MATTEKGIYYPADYDEVADIPDDMKKMAESIDDVIEHDRGLVDEFAEETNQKIETIQAEQVIQNGNIATNTQDITEIKTEQTTQNENIQENTDNIEALTAKHNTEVAELQSQIEDLQEENQALADQIPTGEATGSDITLSDSARYYFKKFIPEGKSEQETYKGVQAFDYENSSTNGLTKITNGYNVQSSNAWSSGNVTILGLKPETTYTFYCLFKQNNVSNTIQVSIRDKENGTTLKGLTKTTNSGYLLGNFTTTSTGNLIIHLYSNLSENAVASNCDFTNILITEGTYTIDNIPSYEPYTNGPAPNPDYECPIKNVGDNVNIFDKSSTPIYKDQVETQEIETGVRVTTQNTGTNHFGIYLIDTVKKLKGKDITASANIVPSSTNLGGMRFVVCDANGSNRTVIIQKNGITGKQSITCNIDNSYEDNKVVGLVLMSNISSASAGDYTDYEDLKVEKGTVATPYSPYNCGNVEVKVENANLWDENWEVGEINGTTGKKANTEEAIRSKNYIKVTPNQAYYFYIGTTNYMNVYQYDSNKNYIGALTGRRNEIITLSNKCYYILFSTATSYGTVYNNNICINLSNPEINGNYFAHEEQTAIFPLEEGQVLHASDTIEDKIVQKRKTIVFDGTENWNLFFSTQGIFTRSLPNTAVNSASTKNVISNYFIGTNRNYIRNNLATADNLISCFGAELTIANKSITTAADFKAWVAEKYANGTPLTIEYELAEPIETEFTEAQRTAKAQIDKLYSYKGTTHITSNANLDVTYRKDPNIRDTRLDALEARVALLEG